MGSHFVVKYEELQRKLKCYQKKLRKLKEILSSLMAEWKEKEK